MWVCLQKTGDVEYPLKADTPQKLILKYQYLQ
jgi:hypothetical protein